MREVAVPFPCQAHLDRRDTRTTVVREPFYVLRQYAHGVCATGSNRYEDDQIDVVSNKEL